ncbi:MAG: hypothetical protein JO224_00445 [Pelomonas sp.]|nr:hypothetical protein [Roseateles sp.]
MSIKHAVCIGLALGGAIGAPAYADGDKVDRPPLQAGDSWTYRQTTETKAGFKEERDAVTLTRATATALYVDVHQDGSTQPPRSLVLSADWGRMRSVNGVETVVNQPLSFPLTKGKTWTVHYREEHPNPQHSWEDVTTTFVVVGPETVKVGAGQFDAIKVEAEGKWVAEVAASSQAAAGAVGASGNAVAGSSVKTTPAHLAEGRIYRAVWYVPAVRRWVKSVDEYYAANGERTERSVGELVGFDVH